MFCRIENSGNTKSGIDEKAAGLVTGAMGNPSTKKMYKKKAAKALKVMENMFDDMQYMFK